MAQNTQVNISALYGDLNQQGRNGDYDKALRTANKILQADSDEQKAFHCKVVCQIQLGRFDDALNGIRKHPHHSSELMFEKGYCEYRLNRTDDSLKTLSAISDPDEKVKELLAQVHYRLENYQDSLKYYKDLIKNTQDDFEEERETNVSAVLAALQLWNHEDTEDLGLREDTYELCYNSACGAIGQEDYKGAMDLLKKAEELCRATFEEDAEASESDIMAELGIIRIQMGYVLQQMGKTDEALKHYNAVIKQKPSDVSLAAVTSNNIITINKDQNVFESQKRIKALTSDGLQHKLTSLQKQAVQLNLSLFYLLQNKHDQCRKALTALDRMSPGDELPSLLEAALLCKEKDLAKAAKVLKAKSESRDGSLSIKLALAQMFLSQGKIYPACEALKSLGAYSYKPGVVSALVSLYMNQEDRDSASDVLNQAVTWYRKNEAGSPELVLLIRANASFQMRNGDPRTAASMLEDLRGRDPNDLKTLAQLISAYSQFDPKKAQDISRELTLPADQTRGLDLDALEASVNVIGPRYMKRAPKGEQSPTSPKKVDEGDLLKKRKKKRKTKLPKNYDAKASPDPERWMPLRERSYYRGRRKKKGNIGKGSQGAVSGASAADLDRSAAAGGGGTPHAEGASSPSGASAGATPTGAGATAKGPRQQKTVGSKAKKKKKGGGKW